MAPGQQVKVVARIRPPLAGEVKDEAVQVLHEEGSTCVTVNNPRDPNQVFKFPFKSCYGRDSTQDEIFENEVQPMIDMVPNGITVTVFAYGVTSSGKTHTMQGSRSEPGIIPRSVEALFARKSQLSRDTHAEVSLSYMEIYKDEVYDLLVNRDNAPKLPVRENGAGRVFVANLTSQCIETLDEFESIYSAAMKRRSVASTNLNRASSRSHAVLTLTITILDTEENRALIGTLNLVDLAGSENNKLTGNDSSRMAESAAINKSLSVLGQVVHALNSGASRIPYRNSKLTRLLQDALGGSSVGLLICNIAPAPKFRQDTLNTLHFAVRTKNIENKPVVNEKDIRPTSRPRTSNAQLSSSRFAPAVPLPSRSSSSRSSLVPSDYPLPSSRVPRPSISTHGGPSSLVGPRKLVRSSKPVEQKAGLNLTEEDINERIAKAVEAEVARRLAERDKESLEETSRISKDQMNCSQERSPLLPDDELITSARRQSVDEEVRQRLDELEHKLENGNSELRMVSELSPVSRKRTGRAYVALARAQSEKNNLQLALELYRKAEAYVPDNVKLKERIIEIEWAVKNGRPFQPSPKRTRKKKAKNSKKHREHAATEATESSNDVPPEPEEATKENHDLCLESSGSLRKRPAETIDDDDTWETPQKSKKGRCSTQDEDGDSLRLAPSKRNRV